MTGKKKSLTLICILAGVPLLAGLAQKPVELLNDKPLIDLNLAIYEADIGRQGGKAQETVITISVRDTGITYNLTPCADISLLRERLRRDCNASSEIRLIDDYAEAHVYREILALLDELRQDIGFRYQFD